MDRGVRWAISLGGHKESDTTEHVHIWTSGKLPLMKRCLISEKKKKKKKGKFYTCNFGGSIFSSHFKYSPLANHNLCASCPYSVQLLFLLQGDEVVSLVYLIPIDGDRYLGQLFSPFVSKLTTECDHIIIYFSIVGSSLVQHYLLCMRVLL